ncbi:MAG TPA: hypothetical protein VGI95_16600 [Caulobacteraceae bacterium]|jgi:hypothetical protein
MRPGSGRRVAVAFGACLLVVAGQAEATVADCRKVPVYTPHCFQLTQPHAGCAAIPYASAPCFSVHGILRGGNGVPAVRLWRSGTKRILGIVGGDGDPAADDLIPAPLSGLTNNPDRGSMRSVEGDFRVCPLALERAGWMRPVCIASATHVVLSPPSRNDYDPPPTPVGQQE